MFVRKTSDGRVEPILADFGFAARVNQPPATQAEVFCFTPEYVQRNDFEVALTHVQMDKNDEDDEEVQFNAGKANKIDWRKVDVFAYTVTLALYVGDLNFNCMEENELEWGNDEANTQLLQSCSRLFAAPAPRGLSQEFKSLLLGGLKFQVLDRPSMSQLLGDSWFRTLNKPSAKPFEKSAFFAMKAAFSESSSGANRKASKQAGNIGDLKNIFESSRGQFVPPKSNVADLPPYESVRDRMSRLQQAGVVDKPAQDAAARRQVSSGSSLNPAAPYSASQGRSLNAAIPVHS